MQNTEFVNRLLIIEIIMGYWPKASISYDGLVFTFALSVENYLANGGKKEGLEQSLVRERFGDKGIRFRKSDRFLDWMQKNHGWQVTNEGGKVGLFWPQECLETGVSRNNVWSEVQDAVMRATSLTRLIPEVAFPRLLAVANPFSDTAPGKTVGLGSRAIEHNFFNGTVAFVCEGSLKGKGPESS